MIQPNPSSLTFPLAPIRDDAELDLAIAAINDLIRRDVQDDLSPAESVWLSDLGELVFDYMEDRS